MNKYRNIKGVPHVLMRYAAVATQQVSMDVNLGD